MRIIGLFLIGLMLGSCTHPIFPSKVMKGAETDSFDVKAWEDQAYHPSHAPTFVPHKVELAGMILKVSHKADGIVILAEEQPLGASPAASSARVERENAPWFAITFQGSVDPKVLQTGNQLLSVGVTNRASPELFGGAPRMLPHLTAQCLHIWNTEEVKNMYLCTGDTTTAGRYPADERTFCVEGHTPESVPSGTHEQLPVK
jgi:hypothetical protein